MSVFWDLRRRDQTSLGLAGQDPIGPWETRIARSYDAWKADFDFYSMNTNLSLTDNRLKYDFKRFSTATLAIYHAAHIVLNTEVLDLQIYAGARNILGRPVSRADYGRSRKVVKAWAKERPESAAKAAWHAAHMLRDGIMNLDRWDVDDVFHYPWCIYLATLTCWAFHFASDQKGTLTPQTECSPRSKKSSRQSNHVHGGSASSDEEDGIVWDANAEMQCLISAMTSGVPEDLTRYAGNGRTTGLAYVVRNHLKTVRWAIVHEAGKVLGGLNAGRLINE